MLRTWLAVKGAQEPRTFGFTAEVGEIPTKLGWQIVNGVPKGIRTPVIAVKGRCPRPG